MNPWRRRSASVDAERLQAAETSVSGGAAGRVSAWVNDALRLDLTQNARLTALARFITSYAADPPELSVEDLRRRRFAARTGWGRDPDVGPWRPRRARGRRRNAGGHRAGLASRCTALAVTRLTPHHPRLTLTNSGPRQKPLLGGFRVPPGLTSRRGAEGPSTGQTSEPLVNPGAPPLPRRPGTHGKPRPASTGGVAGGNPPPQERPRIDPDGPAHPASAPASGTAPTVAAERVLPRRRPPRPTCHPAAAHATRPPLVA